MAARKLMIQFGLIAMSVTLSKTVAAESGFKTVCVGDDPASPHEPTPIKQTRACPACSNADYGSFKKATVAGSTYTLLDVEEIRQAKEEAVAGTKGVLALTAHNIGEIKANTSPDGSTYYLTPADPNSAKVYALIVDTLKEHAEFGLLGLWTPISRTSLYEIYLQDDTLMMGQRARSEQLSIVPVPLTEPDPMLKAQMGMLLPMMIQPYDPATYADTYRTKIDTLLATKTGIEGAKVASSTPSAPTATVDLQSQLDAMLAATSTPSAKTKKRKAAA
jgi:non-homologous end joining protein Ku